MKDSERLSSSVPELQQNEDSGLELETTTNELSQRKSVQFSGENQSPEGKDDGQIIEKSAAQKRINRKTYFETPLVMSNVIKFIFLHILAVWALFRLNSVSGKTLILGFITYILSAWGVTAGAHRLWSHRSYKATEPLKLLLAFLCSMAAQNSIFVWARDHRVHHKCSESEGDPHNANRGFFFSHIGWLMLRKHDEVIKQGAKIDLSDLKSDWIVWNQHKFYHPISFICCIALPCFIPYYFWDETILNAFLISILRYTCVLHGTWCVNSVAHMWGNKPYDIRIMPSENKFVANVALGEGFHNYHHTFPSDYSTSEYRYDTNLTTIFIDIMAKLGLAYDRKKMSDNVVRAKIEKTGPDSGARINIGHFLVDNPY